MKIFKTGVGQFRLPIPRFLIYKRLGISKSAFRHYFLKSYFLSKYIFWDLSDFIENPANPAYTEIDGLPYDFYLENEIESLKTDFTKNHFIIFMILGIFGKLSELLYFWAFPELFVFSQLPRRLLHVFHFVFSPFSLSFLKRGSHLPGILHLL